MANPEHLAILKKGVEAWNAWRKGNRTRADLSGADLSGADLSEADLRRAYLVEANLAGTTLSRAKLGRANLSRADLSGANLSWTKLSNSVFVEANLSGANLSPTDLSRSNLSRANLTTANLAGGILSETNFSGAMLSDANLSWATLRGANLSSAGFAGANLRRVDLGYTVLSSTDFYRADLTEAILMDTTLRRVDLRGARLRNCCLFAISVWDVRLEEAFQQDMLLRDHGSFTITVDNFGVAHLIDFLLINPHVQQAIDTIRMKAALILGRFPPPRKAVLDRLREDLRARHLIPIHIDFTDSTRRPSPEAVSILARMAQIVIADFTDPQWIVQELQTIVRELPSVPVQPILHASQDPLALLSELERYPSVLPAYHYNSPEELAEALDAHVVEPAVRKAKELPLPPRVP